jgi:hypothetical protein
MYEEFGVAARRFFVRQVCVSHIRGLIVISFNSELIYRHLDVPFLSWLCKNSAGYNRTRNFEVYGRAESKKTQKFVFRSALRPNQISFSHDQCR